MNPEIEHAVRLVEDEVADLVQLQLARRHQIADAPGRADHDVGASPHPLHLHRTAEAAEDCDDAALLIAAEAMEAFLDLQGEFAGRRHDEGARAVAVRGARSACQVLQHRQRKGGGLAGAGLGDAEQIAACEQRRNGTCLDGCRLVEALSVESAQKGLGQAEFCEGNRWHEDKSSSAGHRGFMPAAEGERLDVRLPARQWGERVTTENSGRASSKSDRPPITHSRKANRISLRCRQSARGVAALGAGGRPDRVVYFPVADVMVTRSPISTNAALVGGRRSVLPQRKEKSSCKFLFG